jgi:SAM-dependent methyltransferase
MEVANDGPVYSEDLAYIHDSGFDGFAASAAPGLIHILHRHHIRPAARSPYAPYIVELGCGGGTLARHLVDAGFDVLGIDVSPAMIRLARARVPDARFRVASLADAVLPTCQAVMAIGEVVTYVPGGLPALRRWFRRVHRALDPGGLLIFDFLESAERRTFAPRTRFGDDWALSARADVDRTGRLLTRRMTMVRMVGRACRHSRETHRVRIHHRLAIEGALARAGFSVAMRRSFGRCRLLPGDVAVVAQKL